MKDSFILVIDMQNVYSKGQPWECWKFDEAVGNIKKLLDRSDMNAIFTRYIASDNPIGVWKKYNEEFKDINRDKWLNEITDNLKPYLEKHRCYDKSTFSAFKARGVSDAAMNYKSVAITGVVSECCVLSTIMDFIDAGIYVYYIVDAVSGCDKEKDDAVIEVLKGLSPLHISFITSEDYLREGHYFMDDKLKWCRENSPDAFKNLSDEELVNYMSSSYERFVKEKMKDSERGFTSDMLQEIHRGFTSGTDISEYIEQRSVLFDRMEEARHGFTPLKDISEYAEPKGDFSKKIEEARRRFTPGIDISKYIE